MLTGRRCGGKVFAVVLTGIEGVLIGEIVVDGV